jgi:hypothetical protein
MYRITTQLSEVFNCTVPELETKGILAKFKAWLKRHPEIEVSWEPHFGEIVNYEIARKFYKRHKGKF